MGSETAENVGPANMIVYEYLYSNFGEKVVQKFLKKTKFNPKSFKADGKELFSADLALDVYNSCVSSKREEEVSPRKRRVSEESGIESKRPRHSVVEEVILPILTGPKNQKPCFKCNQPGHFAKDCTNEISCYTCKKAGHTSKDCKSIADQAALDSALCYGCGLTGHLKKDCPNGGGDKSENGCAMKKEFVCYHCNENGHLSRDCTKDGGVPCYNCGELGHLSRNCEVSKDLLCYNCKTPGHLSKDCTVENGATSKMLCYKCQQIGHMARSCKEVQNGDARGGQQRRGGGGGSGEEGRSFRGQSSSGRGRARGRGRGRGRDNYRPSFGSGANKIPLGQKGSSSEGL